METWTIEPNLSELNICIVGLGLIGGSLAKALKKKKPKHLWGVDIDEKTLEFCRTQQIIDEGFADPKTPLENSDLVIICLYPHSIISFISENLKSLKKEVILTDVSGHKSYRNELKKLLPPSVTYIGGHPLGGTEHKGIQHADEKLLENKSYILTVEGHENESKVSFLEAVLESIGAETVRMSPEEHDRKIALTSHMPHLLATTLIQCGKINGEIKPIIGGSFQDATRVAAINAELWSQLFIDNKKYLMEQVALFQLQFKELVDLIEKEEKETLKNYLELTKIERGRLMK